MMQLYAVVWLISTGLLISKACDIDSLRGSIKSCSSEDGARIQRIPQYVGNGTHCLVETDSALHQFRCEGDDWLADNSNVMRNGRPPGRHFSEGDSHVTYYAKDTSGNLATCTKTIRVRVKRCSPPTPVHNGYFICHPSIDFVLGGWCKFGCYAGFALQGESLITCTEKETWSVAQPRCKALTCPAPEPIPEASLPTCTDGNRFRSICTYNCKTGFDMPPKVSKTIVCSVQKMWRQFGVPKCIDIEPPTFEICPDTQVFGTNRGINTSQVTWKEPKVRDNSGVDIEPIMTTPHRPGNKLLSGIYNVEYTAEDNDGNKAKPCKFKVIVRDMRCPKLYPTPFVSMTCPDGYRTGTGCTISCDPGKSIQGSNYVTCEEDAGGTFGYWNWMNGQQTLCISTEHCDAIPPPNNGAVVCDNWSGGEFCQLQCKNGTQISGANWRRLFVCSSGGSWYPRKPHVRACAKTRRPTPVIRLDVNFYFYGDCTDEETKSRIGNNFVQLLKSSQFVESCSSLDGCTKDNVMITCGIMTRSKRDLTNATISQPMNLSIHFSVPFTRRTANVSTYDLDSVRSVMNHTNLMCLTNITEIFGSSSAKFIKVSSLGIDVVCEEGLVKVGTSLSCVECPAGTFFSRSKRACTPCSMGTYQDRSGQKTCRRCPFGTTSRTSGASSEADCEDACFPGTFSQDGVIPCSPCETGQYQPAYGQIKCHLCEGTKTTLLIGSTMRSECEEFDIHLSKTGTSTGLLTLAETKIFSEFVTSVWVKEETGNPEADTEGLTIIFNDEQNETVWHLKPFQYIKKGDRQETYIQSGTQETRWQHVHIVSTKCVESGFLNGIQVQGNSSDGLCEPISIKTILIKADNGFGVSISQLNIWNGTGFIPPPSKCVFNSKTPSLSWHEFGNAQLTNSYEHLPSLCDDYDDCLSSPCKNGNCTDVLGGFHCDCDRGFTGSQCDLDIDDCEISVCMNNATCMDEVNGYNCACTPSYTGTYCETRMVDGQWSDWGNWTECTTTCGVGQRKRVRLCNNPHPDNGGRYCPDESFEVEKCNNTICPVCPPIERPANGTMECQHVSDSRTCTLSCDEGFDFDMQPLDNYTCGPDTFYEWNIQNDENPKGRLPKCSEILLPEKLSVHYLVHYRALFCTNDDVRRVAANTIERKIQAIINNVECIRTSTCSLEDFKVIDCSVSRLQKRKATSAGVAMTISVQPNKETDTDMLDMLQDAFDYVHQSAENGSFTVDISNDEYELDIASTSLKETDTDMLDMLQDAFDYVHQSAENGSFTVDISNDEYELDIASTSLKGGVKCRPGTTAVRFYCVPCGRGSYASEGYCKPCKRGTYQDKEGQSVCQSCPSGTTTVGIGSDHIQDCAVSLNAVPNEIKVTSIVVGSVCGAVGVFVLVLAFRRYRSGLRKRLVNPTDMTVLGRPSSGNQLNGFGPHKPVFKLPIGAGNLKNDLQTACMPPID